MKTLILKNGKLEVKEIENTLEELQKIVGGYIEFPFLCKDFFENTIDVIINEEGKLIEGLRPELAIVDKRTNMILDVVYGSCIFASHDEEGNTVSLNTEQIEIVMERLQYDYMLTLLEKEKQYKIKLLFV